MHLNKILEQIKRHQSPTEAIDKLATALEKNGFGRGNQAETNSDFARLAAMGNQNNNTDLLMQAINGNKDAINTLSTNLNCDVKSIDNALCSIQNAI